MKILYIHLHLMELLHIHLNFMKKLHTDLNVMKLLHIHNKITYNHMEKIFFDFFNFRN